MSQNLRAKLEAKRDALAKKALAPDYATEGAKQIGKLAEIVFKSGYNALLDIVVMQAEALEFYANGGNLQSDIWQHKKLGYFTGKRAKGCVKALNEFAEVGE